MDEEELEELVHRYVSGDLSLGQFHSILQEETWSEEDGANDLASTIRLLVGEATTARWSDSLPGELVRVLRQRASRELQNNYREQLAEFEIVGSSTVLGGGRFSSEGSIRHIGRTGLTFTTNQEGQSNASDGDPQLMRVS